MAWHGSWFNTPTELSMDLTPQQLTNSTAPTHQSPYSLQSMAASTMSPPENPSTVLVATMPCSQAKTPAQLLQKMSKKDVCPNLDGLSAKEMDVLKDCIKKFEPKYPVNGRVVS